MTTFRLLPVRKHTRYHKIYLIKLFNNVSCFPAVLICFVFFLKKDFLFKECLFDLKIKQKVDSYAYKAFRIHLDYPFEIT